MQPVNAHRFEAKTSHKLLPKLTRKKVQALEKASCVSPIEKVRLLALLCSKRWMTDIKIDSAKVDQLKELSALFGSLGLASMRDSYTKRDGTAVHWVQVGANQAIIEYLQTNRARLSVMEAGLLYGYPATAILGCCSIIESKSKASRLKSPAEIALGGVFSKQFEEYEAKYISLILKELSKVSPRIVDDFNTTTT